jgi:hypothetical protein
LERRGAHRFFDARSGLESKEIAMSEMIVPGTYIDVRAEGLISAGGVATGVVAVVGTARSGPVGTPITLSGFSQARELFGLPDKYSIPEDGSNPLTLVRSLQLAYANGASTVVAVRVASPRAASASYALKDSAGNTVAVLTAATPGTWGNDIQISVSRARTPARIDRREADRVLCPTRLSQRSPQPTESHPGAARRHAPGRQLQPRLPLRRPR